MKILGRYKITYKEGHIQEKNLISHSEYLNVVKPLVKMIHDLEQEDGKEAEIAPIARRVKAYGDFFTDESPLFEAIETGILNTSLGEIPIKLEKI